MERVKNGLYKLFEKDFAWFSISSGKSFNNIDLHLPIYNNVTLTEGILWHKRLGCPYYNILQKVVNECDFKIRNNSLKFFYGSCQSSKSHC